MNLRLECALFTALAAMLGGFGCTRSEDAPQSTFYERRIGPVLTDSCGGRGSATTSGCHSLAADGSNALGNLSFDSYQTVGARHDLLLDYGPYGIPGLLLKVVPPFRLSLTSWNSSDPILITTDIRHAADQLIDFTSPVFTTLERWMLDGATENNAPREQVARPVSGCSEAVGTDPLFDPSADPAAPDFGTFVSRVNPVLRDSCSAGNCHGSPANALYITCGDTQEQVRWNYFAAGDYISNDPVSSEILQRVLAPAAGGTYHEGGTIFRTNSEAGYQALLAWAMEKAGPTFEPTDAGFQFFATRVQPMLVKRGCMMLGCHSASMFHDYRLHGGAGGHFGLPATRRNYALSLEQVALESSDPNTSRLIRKNLEPTQGGMLHRGGSLFFGQTPEGCDLVAAETGALDDQSPYCVIVAWIAQERAARMAALAPLGSIVYVRRPARTGTDIPQEWGTFQGGAEVVSVGATLGADGTIALGAETSLSAACGLDPASSDARRPAVSWDGARVAFSARSSAADPFHVYLVEGGSCAADAAIDAAATDDRGAGVPTNGELVHNFDPTFAPDGRIVFVSTRGNIANTGAFSYSGPQRTPADPSRLNTNLYVRELDGTIRQLTFLLNQELSPSFMRDGRVILTTEKRAPNFYQLAGRRINLDGGDYHPLFGQRSSIGFNQFTDVVELADKNLAAIVSQRGAAHGAGALAIVNRSIGIDIQSSDPADFPANSAAIGMVNPDFYQHSFSLVDGAATGRLDGTTGAYRSPSPLPDGQLLASYAANVTDLASFAGGFDVVVVNPSNGQRTNLIAGANDELWPVAVYAKPAATVFRSRLDEVNGASHVVADPSGHAEVLYLDLPLLTSLLFQNTRSGRDFVQSGATVELWQSLPPEPGVNSFSGSFVTSDAYGSLYVRRSFIGAIGPESDGSAKVILPGGMPYLLATQVQLEGDPSPTFHFQREEMQVYPGERVRQSFQRGLFNGMCGGCHGSVSGHEYRVALNPDVLTQASVVVAKDTAGAPYGDAPTRAAEGPDFP